MTILILNLRWKFILALLLALPVAVVLRVVEDRHTQTIGSPIKIQVIGCSINIQVIGCPINILQLLQRELQANVAYEKEA